MTCRDRGHLLGDGVFETMRTHGDVIWQEARHRARMEQGAEWLGLAMDAWDDVVADLLARGRGDRRLRIELTAGDMTGLMEGSGARMSGSVMAFEPHPDAPIRLISSDVAIPVQPWSGCKTLSMFPYVQALRMAHARGADDAVLSDGQNGIVEATTSNVFAHVEGTWHSPGPCQGAVDGVTRQVLLEHIDAVPQLHRDQLARADAVALTNTRGVRVASTLDGRALDLQPARALQQLFAELQP